MAVSIMKVASESLMDEDELDDELDNDGNMLPLAVVRETAAVKVVGLDKISRAAVD